MEQCVEATVRIKSAMHAAARIMLVSWHSAPSPQPNQPSCLLKNKEQGGGKHKGHANMHMLFTRSRRSEARKAGEIQEILQAGHPFAAQSFYCSIASGSVHEGSEGNFPCLRELWVRMLEHRAGVFLRIPAKAQAREARSSYLNHTPETYLHPLIHTCMSFLC